MTLVLTHRTRNVKWFFKQIYFDFIVTKLNNYVRRRFK